MRHSRVNGVALVWALVLAVMWAGQGAAGQAADPGLVGVGEGDAPAVLRVRESEVMVGDTVWVRVSAPSRPVLASAAGRYAVDTGNVGVLPADVVAVLGEDYVTFNQPVVAEVAGVLKLGPYEVAVGGVTYTSGEVAVTVVERPAGAEEAWPVPVASARRGAWLDVGYEGPILMAGEAVLMTMQVALDEPFVKAVEGAGAHAWQRFSLTPERAGWLKVGPVSLVVGGEEATAGVEEVLVLRALPWDEQGARIGAWPREAGVGEPVTVYLVMQEHYGRGGRVPQRFLSYVGRDGDGVEQRHLGWSIRPVADRDELNCSRERLSVTITPGEAGELVIGPEYFAVRGDRLVMPFEPLVIEVLPAE